MKKITLCLMIILALILVPGVIFAAATPVTTQEQFVENVEKGNEITISQNLTIKLEKDLTVTNKITIGAYSGTKATVTMDLNGHTIKFNGSSAQLYVQNAGELIVEDSIGTGLITNAGANSGNSYLVQVKGICEINGGTIENTLSSKKALYLQGDTKVATGILNNGTIINKYTGGGSAVSVGKGTFTMNGGKVINKAAGTTGLAAAIEGKEITINGGTIEAAGTGIKSSSTNVKITGGTIEAGWFGLHTSNVIIKPAEGKTVNITVPTPEEEKTEHGFRRAAALIITDDKLTTGGNEIYGGNFNAPMFMETKYDCDPDNMIVYGGTFTHEVPAEYVAPGYVVNKIGDKYKVELNIPNIVDDDLKADDELEMGVTSEIQEILKKEIDENKEIQDALLEGKKVDIHVKMEKVEEEDVKEELEAVKEKAKDKEIAKLYDITLVVKVDGTQVDTISETSSKLKFKVLIPEELIKEGRTFFMYRYHDGKVEEITGELDDENYFVFESDRFSTYVLAYEDKVEDKTQGGQGEAEKQPEEDKKDEVVEENKKEETNKKEENIANSPTGDNVVIFAIIAVVAIAGLVFVKRLNTVKSKH